MNALLVCQCQGMDPFCSLCKGHEELEVSQSFRIPNNLDFDTLKFEPIAGLFQVFQMDGEILGAGNIEYQPASRSYFIHEIQTFRESEGHTLMIKTMLAADDIDFIEGRTKWEECL